MNNFLIKGGRSNIITGLISCLSLLIVAESASALSITYKDDTFNDSDWSAERIQGLSTTSFSTQQVVSGGNPDEYRSTRHNYTTGNGNASIRVVHESLNNVYDPNLGSINDINFSYDAIFLDAIGHTGVEYLPVIFQDGNAFVPNEAAPDRGTNGSRWKNFNLTLKESDFLIFEPGSHLDDGGYGTENPNFSIDGSIITFGYMTTNGSRSRGTADRFTVSGLDNFSVTVNHNVVPEPLTILGAGTAVAFGTGFKRKLGKAKKNSKDNP
ncbi:MAG: PEP-CTERM sorting domain-containing protein [Crocosphaera sp.]